MPPLRRTAAIVLAMLSILALAAPVAAKPGSGNSTGSAACDNGGYLNYTRADASPFKNEGDCTKYTAKGNTLVPKVRTLAIGVGVLGAGFESEDSDPWQSETLGCRTGLDVRDFGGGFVLRTEHRFALEFPLALLPANANVTGATLSIRTSRQDLALQTAIHPYAGNGVIAVDDVTVTATPLAFTPVGGFEDVDVTTLLTPGMVSAGWAGLSFRQDPLGASPAAAPWNCPNTFPAPILTIEYSVP